MTSAPTRASSPSSENSSSPPDSAPPRIPLVMSRCAANFCGLPSTTRRLRSPKTNLSFAKILYGCVPIRFLR